MKQRTLVKNLGDNVNQIVTVMGFVQKIRNQKHVQFIILSDHTGEVQIVHSKNSNHEMAITIGDLTPGSTIHVTGMAINAPQVKLNGVEIQLQSISVDSTAKAPLPISATSSLEKQMDWRQVSLRTASNFLIFAVQTTMEKAMREYWMQHDFIEIHSPKLMGTASESGAELFKLDYFNDKKAYLAQSPQFYKQLAIAGGLDRVFEIGPVFRANPSFTSRHDTEFTSIDMEIAWIESHEDLMRIEEEWLVHVLSAIKQQHDDDIFSTFGTEVTVPDLPFPRITLAEARSILQKNGHSIDHKADLDPQGERLLSKYILDEYGHEFVFVTDYPVEVRPFYHMRHPENPGLTKSFDLLWKGIEITTGAQREHRLHELITQAIKSAIQLDPITFYLDFFQFGCPPHGGLGVGLTRLLMMMLDKNNVREVTYVYRGPNRLFP